MAFTDADIATVEAALLARLSTPQRVRGDAGEVEHHTLDHLLAALAQVRSTGTSTHAHRGLRFTKIIPPGTVA